MKKILILFILDIFIISNAFTQSGRVSLGNNLLSGNGSYEDPYIIDTDLIKWSLSISDDDGQTTYMTSLHQHIGRSCYTEYKVENMDYRTANNSNHSFKGICGAYYFNIKWYKNGEKAGEHRRHVHCRVPIIDSYTVPYKPPATNHLPTPVITLINIVSGSGISRDPYVIAGTTVQFYVKDSYDKDGIGDIEYGCWHWAIITHGWHPVYNKGQDIEDAAKTYAYYDEFYDLQEWDTTERPSNDGLYRLTLYLIDRHGERNDTTLHFICDGSVKPPNPDTQPPTPPKNVKVVDN